MDLKPVLLLLQGYLAQYTTLKIIRFNMAQVIQPNRQGTQKGFTQVEYQPKYTTSFGYPVDQNEKCAYRCHKGEYQGIH